MTERGRAAGAIGAKCENPVRAMSKRLRKVLRIGLVSLVAAVLLTAAAGGFWLHRQLQPQDLTAARSRWPAAMTFEQADRAALDLVAQMTLDEKLHEMTGSGLGPMIAGLLVRGEGRPGLRGRQRAAGHPAHRVQRRSRGVGASRRPPSP